MYDSMILLMENVQNRQLHRDRKYGSVFSCGWWGVRRKYGRGDLKDYGILWKGDKTVLKLWYGCTVMNILKTIELYVLNGSLIVYKFYFSKAITKPK